ncbi:Nucleoporin-like protein amo1 [Anthophora retusa]
MVVCKYYRQGNCRYGQYCQFEHINTFGGNTKVDSYNEDEYTAELIAKEVLSAEKGGQWLLSCFGPLAGRPCIPGIEDLSPEEVRWEMYQAQKNGMVEQAKLHFQQLCQDIKAKREALKNPTRETLTKLKEILGTGRKNTTNDNTSAKPSSFSFATPQLGLPSSTTSSNVFGNKNFGTQSNPFSGGFTASSNTSIFARPTTASNPVFGQNTQTFGTSGSIFGGGAPQTVFCQSNMFGATNQVNNVFGRHQTSQSTTSVFNSGTTNSIFGTTPSAGTFNTGIFSQAETPAFGGAPVFGTASFGNTPSTIFGEKPAFANTGGIFGGPNTTTPTFSSAQPTGAFNVTTSTPAVNLFGVTQTTTAALPTSNASPFGATPSTTASPFATATSQFETTNTTAFAKPTFGIATGTTGDTFGTTVTNSSSTPFGATNTAVAFGAPPATTTSPFTPSTFADTKGSPFGPTSVTATTTTTNAFTPQQQQITSPFGKFAQSQTSKVITTSSNGPFGKFAFGVTVTAKIIDDSIYSIDNQLTDDEKNMYLAEKFVFGKIPLKPPTKEIK